MIRFLISLLIILASYDLRAEDKIQITSSSLTFNKKDLTAAFEGDVKIFFEDQIILTDKLIIYYSNKREIIKIIFPTKIKAIKTGEKIVIVADSGEFDNLAKKLTLTGKVYMQKDDNVLVTDKMIYYAKLKPAK
jgi:lipopolysaccharide export system protein LptA